MLYCDWCDEPIRDVNYATLEPGGCFHGGKRVRLPVRTYHTSFDYGDSEPSDYCCFAHVLRLLNATGDFKTPDAGWEWKLVPCSEGANPVYQHGYTSAALGREPLAELGLPAGLYRDLTKHGIFTVEHAVDARDRGEVVGLTAKQLGRLDTALLERGLLPARAQRTDD